MRLKVSKRKILSNVEIHLTGAKNALLHLMFASLVANKSIKFSNAPMTLHDYKGVCSILNYLGVEVYEQAEATIEISADIQRQKLAVPLDYTKKTRTSLMLLGALVKKVDSLTIGYPGGCSFSDRRPFDIHLEGFKALGAKVTFDEYNITIEHIKEQDAQFTLRYPSVGASINLMLYAAYGKARVILHNVALEPEVIEVASFLNQCGANIGIDHHSRSIEIHGKTEFKAVDFRVMYDRIQTMTYAALAYLHQVDVKVFGVDTTEYIQAPLNELKILGARWQFDAAKQSITFLGQQSKLKGGLSIKAKPFPEFPTDLQPIFAVMLSRAKSHSCIEDTVYPERIKYVKELKKIGFPIELKQTKHIKVAPLLKTQELHASSMNSFDLRAGMAVVMAASLCSQVSIITNAQQVFRGYDHLLENMSHFMHIAIDKEDV